MVKRSDSEYTRQYTRTNVERNVPNYYRCVNYRESRRRQEHLHTPISWDTGSNTCLSDRMSPCSIDSLSKDCLHLSLRDSKDSDFISSETYRVKHKTIQTDRLSESDYGSLGVDSDQDGDDHNFSQSYELKRIARKSSKVGEYLARHHVLVVRTSTRWLRGEGFKPQLEQNKVFKIGTPCGSLSSWLTWC